MQNISTKINLRIPKSQHQRLLNNTYETQATELNKVYSYYTLNAKQNL